MGGASEVGEVDGSPVAITVRVHNKAARLRITPPVIIRITRENALPSISMAEVLRPTRSYAGPVTRDRRVEMEETMVPRCTSLSPATSSMIHVVCAVVREARFASWGFASWGGTCTWVVLHQDRWQQTKNTGFRGHIEQPAVGCSGIEGIKTASLAIF